MEKEQSSSCYPLEDHELDTISNDDLSKIIKAEMSKAENKNKRVIRLSENAFAKTSVSSCAPEARNMQFVAANTSIRVPTVLRCFEGNEILWPTKAVLVMQYIHGAALTKECWNTLDISKREHVHAQVQGIVDELQALHVDKPGPIGGGKSEGPWFTDFGAGPFDNIHDLQAWFNNKLRVCKRMNRVAPDTPEFRFSNLVLCHMDITPRNLILDLNDNIWLIDWEFSGAYPAYFERAGISIQQECPDFRLAMLSRWKEHEVDVRRLYSLTWALTTGAAIVLPE